MDSLMVSHLKGAAVTPVLRSQQLLPPGDVGSQLPVFVFFFYFEKHGIQVKFPNF